MQKTAKITTDELERLESKNYSEQQIAEYYGISRMCLYKYRLKHGCKRLKRSHIFRDRVSKDDKRANQRKYMKEYRSRYKLKTGRAANRKRNTRIMQRIALNILGRPLNKGEVIHHIDNNPTNNSHDNLVICTQSYHKTIFHTNIAENKLGITR